MVPMGLYILEDSNRTPCLRGIHRTPSGMLALPCRPGTTVIVDRFLDLDMQVSMSHLVGISRVLAMSAMNPLIACTQVADMNTRVARL